MKNRMNPNQMNNQQMMNAYGQMSMMGSIQKIGKGKRKYNVKIDKTSKKYLAKIVEELKKQMGAYALNPQTKGVTDYMNYLENECKKKNDAPIAMSFEELEFLRKTLSDSVKAMETMEFKWYQLLRKMLMKVMLSQHKYILQELNK